MVTLTYPKSPLSSLHIFSSKSSSSPTSSSSSLTTMKLKTLIHNLIFSHICRLIRALSKAKSIFLDIFHENQLIFLKQSKRKNKYRNKLLFGSFRLHYNWCSSSAHVLPIPSPILIDTPTATSHIYYDSTWNSAYSTGDGDRDHHAVDDQDCELSSYLQWLEEKGGKYEILNEGEGKDENEIDKLADMFIASCHEKFRLEKIESYRRYQELLARSL